MSDPRLDAELRAYLAEQARDRMEGNTITNLRLELGQLRVEVQEIVTEVRLLKMRVDRHGRDIAAIKQRLDWEGPEVDTGQHQVEDLKRALAVKEEELRERKDDGLWWRRSAIKWIVGGVAWVITTLAAVLIATALGKK